MNEQTAQDQQHRCKINRINAEMMEDAVLSRLNEIIISENYLPNVQNKIMDRVNERLGSDQETISNLSKNGSRTIRHSLSDELEKPYKKVGNISSLFG